MREVSRRGRAREGRQKGRTEIDAHQDGRTLEDPRVRLLREVVKSDNQDEQSFGDSPDEDAKLYVGDTETSWEVILVDIEERDDVVGGGLTLEG